jgi:ParB-like nuclease domain
MLRGEGYNTAKAREDPLADVEWRLVREGHTGTVQLYPKQIKTMPELFQPRMFSYDGRATDEKHVKTLVDAIETDGKIDPPPLVIKLKHKGFVIVDGHHTLAAYKKVKEHEQIECEWFAGTVREAWDEAVRRNRKDKLMMHKDDKTQQAWERVLIGGWTTQQIMGATGKSRSTVKSMRRVKRAARKSERFQRRLLEDVRGWKNREGLEDFGDWKEREGLEDFGELAVECLKKISWTRARLIFAGVGDREIADEEDAARLERMLRSNVRDKYMLKPKVVAIALKLYNPDFPVEITTAWEELKEHPEVFEKAKSAERRMAKQYQERVAKAAETRALVANAERQEREGALRLQRLEEDAKARKAAAAAQESAETPQGPAETLGTQGDAEAPEGGAHTTQRGKLVSLVKGQALEKDAQGAAEALGTRGTQRPRKDPQRPYGR